MRKLLEQPSESLSLILNHAEQLKQLNQLLQQIIREDLAPHCQVANYDNGILVIGIDNPSWAMLFRYYIPELLQNFRKFLPQLKSISHYIIINDTPLYRKRVLKPLSAQTMDAILADLSYLNDEDELKQAFLRLAKHASGGM